MTTFMYTTTSRGGQLSETTPVENILTEYYFTVTPKIKNNQLIFYAESKPNSAFDVYETPQQMNSVVDDFLERISEYLETEIEVRCVEVEGHGAPEAWKVVATPEGEVTHTSL